MGYDFFTATKLYVLVRSFIIGFNFWRECVKAGYNHKYYLKTGERVPFYGGFIEGFLNLPLLTLVALLSPKHIVARLIEVAIAYATYAIFLANDLHPPTFIIFSTLLVISMYVPFATQGKGVFSWLMQNSMKKEARRLAKWAATEYKKAKDKSPDENEQEIALGMLFNRDEFSKLPPDVADRFKLRCQTLNGLCYVMALDMGKFKGIMNLRALQFTSYMDKELKRYGFEQTYEQKKSILEVMELAIDGWERITGHHKISDLAS